VLNQERICKKDTCYNEIGLHADDLDIIMGAVIDTIGRMYVITWRERGSSFWPFMNFVT
jgi:hypothetical protein